MKDLFLLPAFHNLKKNMFSYSSFVLIVSLILVIFKCCSAIVSLNRFHVFGAGHWADFCGNAPTERMQIFSVFSWRYFLIIIQELTVAQNNSQCPALAIYLRKELTFWRADFLKSWLFKELTFYFKQSGTMIKKSFNF